MRSKSVPIESLRQIELFTGCDDRVLRRLSGLGTPVQVGEKQWLAHEGRPGREFYVIVDGTAEVRHANVVLAQLGRGDFFGEMALIDGRPRSADVVAITPMTLYVFDPREFFSLLDDFPAISRQILRGMAERLRAAQAETETPDLQTAG